MASRENALADQRRAARLQNTLHSTLGAMFSGAILQPNKSLPGTKRNCLVPYWAEQISNIRVDVEGDGPLDSHSDISNSLFGAAKAIAAGYSCLDQMIGALEPSSTMRTVEIGYQLEAKRYEENPRAYELLQRLQQYWLKNGAPGLLGAYVHGSYSTADLNRYSDLDALVILKREAACNPETLFALAKVAAGANRLLLQADLLQHHSHFVLTEIDLNFYCDAYFPRILFRVGTELWSEKPLAIGTVRDSQTEAYTHLRKMCERFMMPWKRRQLHVAFHMKMQLSCFMILPALLLQVIERPCYKRESFALARPLFDEDTWKIMDEVSELRHSWRQTSVAPVVWLASACPTLWRQLIYRFGTWGVPETIWRQVRDGEFRGRMTDFARKCLDIASKARTKL